MVNGLLLCQWQYRQCDRLVTFSNATDDNFATYRLTDKPVTNTMS